MTIALAFDIYGTLIDPHGVEVFRKSGLVDDPDVFLLMGRYFVEERYTDTTFADYLQEHGRQAAEAVYRTPAAED